MGEHPYAHGRASPDAATTTTATTIWTQIYLRQSLGFYSTANSILFVCHHVQQYKCQFYRNMSHSRIARERHKMITHSHFQTKLSEFITNFLMDTITVSHITRQIQQQTDETNHEQHQNNLRENMDLTALFTETHKHLMRLSITNHFIQTSGEKSNPT